MKYLFSLIVIAFMLIPLDNNVIVANSIDTEISIEQSEDYKNGWVDGHCEGWKDVKGQYAYCPHAPYPPYPAYGQNTYRGGYNAGFKAGTRAAYKSQ